MRRACEMAARLRIECLHCHRKMVTERFFWNPGRVKVVCHQCESIIPVTLTAEDLARGFADQTAETALD